MVIYTEQLGIKLSCVRVVSWESSSVREQCKERHLTNAAADRMQINT